MGGAIRGDGKGTEEGEEGDRHPPHAMSAPTIQPWLRPRHGAVAKCQFKTFSQLKTV